MTNASGINSFTSGAPPATPPPAPPSQSSTSVSAITSKPITAPKTEGVSPRITVDPTAGVIIQYLTGTDQVQLQIPSTTVVAYLKAGLTPEGLSKPLPNTQHGGTGTLA